MPWHIEARDGQFCVVKDADDTTEACHDTEEKAKRHMAALYANEPKASAADRSASTFAVTTRRSRPTSNVGRSPGLGSLGAVARSGYAKWKFARGSLHWAAEKRVKLNLGHERKETVGVAVALRTLPPASRVRVARGEQGDRALSLALRTSSTASPWRSTSMTGTPGTEDPDDRSSGNVTRA